jgi:hypothetical protein
VLLRRVPSSSSPVKGLYNPKAFFTHAASLDQACAHCPRFPTAASRRSLGRVSVPVWPITLSDQLPIAALVGRYPTNKLIGRGPIPRRKSFAPEGDHPVLAAVSSGCPGPWGRFPRVTHPCATRSRAEARPRVRLACVKRAASVRSEPGSNSQLHPAQASLLTRSPGLPTARPAHARLSPDRHPQPGAQRLTRSHADPHRPATDPLARPCCRPARTHTVPARCPSKKRPLIRPPPAHPFLFSTSQTAPFAGNRRRRNERYSQLTGVPQVLFLRNLHR